MKPAEALQHLLQRRDLPRAQMHGLMQEIMAGRLTPVQTAAILVALRAKGESVDEITAAAQVMRELSTRVDSSHLTHVVDTCGTGGDGQQTFNISTAAAFVAAGAGARVAKHGGRSVSSSSGSADVLEALGADLSASTPTAIRGALEAVGVGFMFAPNHHSAMRHAAPVRRELGVRTLFNLLGPLSNPAGAPNQVMGVFHPDLVPLQAHVLQQLGSRHVMVVHGCDGLDEITLTGPTHVAELKGGEVMEYQLDPTTLGFAPSPLDSLRVSNAQESRNIILAVLADTPGPARDIVTLNAGAALYVSGVATSLGEGVALARESLSSGAAARRLEAFVAHSRAAASAGEPQ